MKTYSLLLIAGSLVAGLAQQAFAAEEKSPAPKPSNAWFAPDRRFSLGGSFLGYYSSAGISPVLGGKAQLNAYLHERIQLVTMASLLAVDKGLYPFGDIRLRFWGTDAGSWYPALSFDIGYIVRIGDWFVPERPDKVVHTPVFGGRFTFPLDRLRGRVFADWAGGWGGSWFFAFYCGAEWRVAGPLGVRIEGDIFTRPGAYKYTGWSVGPYVEW